MFCVIIHIKTTHLQRLERYKRIPAIIDFASGHNKMVGNIWQSWSRIEVGCWRLDGVSATWVPEVECWPSTAEPHQNCDPCIPGRFGRIVYRLDHQLARNVIQVFHETSRQRERGSWPPMAMTYELCPWLVYLNLDYIETGISNLRFYCSENLLRCS